MRQWKKAKWEGRENGERETDSKKRGERKKRGGEEKGRPFLPTGHSKARYKRD